MENVKNKNFRIPTDLGERGVDARHIFGGHLKFKKIGQGFKKDTLFARKTLCGKWQESSKSNAKKFQDCEPPSWKKLVEKKSPVPSKIMSSVCVDILVHPKEVVKVLV